MLSEKITAVPASRLFSRTGVISFLFELVVSCKIIRFRYPVFDCQELDSKKWPDIQPEEPDTARYLVHP